MSGLELEGADPSTTFLELGLDSLVLTQVAIELKRRFGVNLAFRQLTEEYASLQQLAAHLDAVLPEDKAAPAPAAAALQAAAQVTAPAPVAAPAPLAALPMFSVGPVAGGDELQQVINAQLRLMQQQLMLLSGVAPQQVAAAPAVTAPAAQAPQAPAPQAAAPQAAPAKAEAEEPAAPQKYDVKKAFGAIARIHTQRGTESLTPKQRARLDAVTRRYTQKTRGSKAYTTQHRGHMADPRVVTGFRPPMKELVYPIVIERSKGARLWDVDGNEYVDALNGFGSNFFGYSPDFVQEALKKQIDAGFEVGPQHPLAGEVSKLICEFTGHDRVGLCNTGSEAVMGCMRIARTVTGRRTIAIFTGSYHGIFDEVIVRATKSRAMPAAPGIMPSTSENVLVLDYGTERSLEILKERAHELAAILVEPVQSRRPDFQPKEFLQELRKLTQECGAALIFDEVITGFRTGPGGAQAHFGIKADLASYGKVVGGGLSIGVIAGKREWMDALDGGHWQFGDDSVPTVGVTYFAGTFVRHPLALASAKAALEYMKQHGPALQQRLNGMTDGLAGTLNAFFDEVGAPLHIKHFSSLWKVFWKEEQAWGDLLFVMLRDRGLHILDGFPCFLTVAYTQAEVDFIVRCFKEAVAEMQEAGFFPPSKVPAGATVAPVLDPSRPPVPGARLGRDPSGNPAWYVPSPSEPGKYVKHEG
ncbi:aminotransferase class III-fold pyridoxal phosphate-dependent enzyme [Aggregicoccus sp. 17bor-14]|nr:aminotransferase class III-fold pyridoxal phosphate-dependent enzyme [Simulacricoccus sp. 17bor-14]MRI87858.1 aminotransferase class III-fold pyridoxal phosphate-dependent enzyme [Aggregicoccus sp. 17bor-14]